MSKKVIPAHVRLSAGKYARQICEHMELSRNDQQIILNTIEIFNWARLWHPSHEVGGLKVSAESISKSLALLTNNPATVRMLRLIYRWIDKEDIMRPSLEMVGASILTIVDIFSENMCNNEQFTRGCLQMVQRGFMAVTDKLVLRQVVDAFVAILGKEVKERGEEPVNVILYSDKPNNFYVLKTKLRAIKCETITPDSLEQLVSVCRRQPRAVMVLYLHSAPLNVIKTLQYINNSGVELGAISIFLMVSHNTVQRLITLLEMGIEDIMDVDYSADVLVSKIKKVLVKLKEQQTDDASEQESGSRGTLSDMNLVDLLQALGPSRRTVRITIKQKSALSEPLVIYLNQGKLIYAKLGAANCCESVSIGMSWQDGIWTIDQISPEELPESNNTLSIEAVLMQACQMLDESDKILTPAKN